MENKTFTYWLSSYTKGGNFTTLTLAHMQAAWDAATLQSQEPMACGHPKTCLIPDVLEPYRVFPKGATECFACEHERKAIEKAVCAMANSIKEKAEQVELKILQSRMEEAVWWIGRITSLQCRFLRTDSVEDERIVNYKKQIDAMSKPEKS